MPPVRAVPILEARLTKPKSIRAHQVFNTTGVSPTPSHGIKQEGPTLEHRSGGSYLDKKISDLPLGLFNAAECIFMLVEGPHCQGGSQQEDDYLHDGLGGGAGGIWQGNDDQTLLSC